MESIKTSLVTVISCSTNDAWKEASMTMGKNLASSANKENKFTVVCPQCVDEFCRIWKDINGALIVHTHGSSEGFFDEINGFSIELFTKKDLPRIEKNDHIHLIVITACSTAGGDENNNIAACLSKLINIDGIVIANRKNVFGDDTYFHAQEKTQDWVVYRNGEIIIHSCEMPITLTLDEAYKIYRSLVI